jgi:hypothetical protein
MGCGLLKLENEAWRSVIIDAMVGFYLGLKRSSGNETRTTLALGSSQVVKSQTGRHLICRSGRPIANVNRTGYWLHKLADEVVLQIRLSQLVFGTPQEVRQRLKRGSLGCFGVFPKIAIRDREIRFKEKKFLHSDTNA